MKSNGSEYKNVLAVVTAMGAGGLETYLVNVLSAIDREKFRFKIAYTGKHNSWFDEELRAIGVETIFCPNPYIQLPYIRRIYKIMKIHKIDVVCDFRSDFAGPTLLAAKMANVRNRIALYRSTSPLFKPTIAKKMYLSLMHFLTKKFANTIVGNSESVLNAFYLNWKSDNKFVVINNGVRLDKFIVDGPTDSKSTRLKYNIPLDAVLVGHVGRFNIAKNHTTLVKSFAKLKARNSNVHLILVGDGELKNSVEALVSELKIGEFVTFAGRVKQVAQFLGAMDIFCFPSIYEGQPNALIEAMASGLSVVASNISEIKETVPQSLKMNLFEPDDIEGFSNALFELSMDPQKRMSLGETAREHARTHFDLSLSVEKFSKILEKS